MRTIVDKPGTLYLGKQGENLVRELAFREPACWAEESGGQGIAQLLVKPSGCGTAYPVILEQKEDVFVWRITAADTARAGYGSCELRWSVEDHVVKSRTYATFVAKSVLGDCGGDGHCTCGPSGGPADRWSAYLEQIVQAGAEALEAAARSERAILHSPTILMGTWWIWDYEQDDYVDTGVPASGATGSGSYNLQSKAVVPTKFQQSVTPDSGYYGLSYVTVEPIPESYQDVSAVTVEAGDVLKGKVFVDAEGKTITGTMPSNGELDTTLDGLTATSVTIPAGYTSGGTVSLTGDIETALAVI